MSQGQLEAEGRTLEAVYKFVDSLRISTRSFLSLAVDVALGRGPHVSRTVSPVEVLGSVTVFCCLNNKGVLSENETAPESLLVFKDGDIQVVDVTRQPRNTITNIELAGNWKACEASLKPLGLAAVLNNHCNFDKTLLDRLPQPIVGTASVGALSESCLCLLGREIGFDVDATRFHFPIAKTIYDRYIEGRLPQQQHQQHLQQVQAGGQATPRGPQPGAPVNVHSMLAVAVQDRDATLDALRASLTAMRSVTHNKLLALALARPDIFQRMAGLLARADAAEEERVASERVRREREENAQEEESQGGAVAAATADATAAVGDAGAKASSEEAVVPTAASALPPPLAADEQAAAAALIEATVGVSSSLVAESKEREEAAAPGSAAAAAAAAAGGGKAGGGGKPCGVKPVSLASLSPEARRLLLELARFSAQTGFSLHTLPAMLATHVNAIGLQLLTRGDPSLVLPHCSRIWQGSGFGVMTPEARDRLVGVWRQWDHRCLTVLAYAYAPVPSEVGATFSTGEDFVVVPRAPQITREEAEAAAAAAAAQQQQQLQLQQQQEQQLQQDQPATETARAHGTRAPRAQGHPHHPHHHHPHHPHHHPHHHHHHGHRHHGHRGSAKPAPEAGVLAEAGVIPAAGSTADASPGPADDVAAPSEAVLASPDTAVPPDAAAFADAARAGTEDPEQMPLDAQAGPGAE